MKDSCIQSFNNNFKLWKACNRPGEDSVRSELEYVFFENGYAYASNAHILARVPLNLLTNMDDDSLALLNGHGIHGPLMKYLADLGPLSVEKDLISNEKGEVTEKVHINTLHGENEVKVTLTNPEQVKAPKFAKLFDVSGERVPISKIGISQKLLDRLTSALGTTDIKMGFISESRQIFVSPLHLAEEGAEGVIMPMMITGTFEGFE